MEVTVAKMSDWPRGLTLSRRRSEGVFIGSVSVCVVEFDFGGVVLSIISGNRIWKVAVLLGEELVYADGGDRVRICWKHRCIGQVALTIDAPHRLSIERGEHQWENAA